MAYQTQTFTDNETVLTAAMMDHIEAGIVANETSIEDMSTDLASYYVQKNVIATSFDATTPYTKGQYVWYENILCRFLVDHEPGAFVDEEVEYLSEDGLSGEVASAVRYDTAQSLTPAQEAQARGNIGAQSRIESDDSVQLELNDSEAAYITGDVGEPIQYNTATASLVFKHVAFVQGGCDYVLSLSSGQLASTSYRVEAIVDDSDVIIQRFNATVAENGTTETRFTAEADGILCVCVDTSTDDIQLHGGPLYGTVRYNTPQSLTAAQQVQARANAGAADVAEFDAVAYPLDVEMLTSADVAVRVIAGGLNSTGGDLNSGTRARTQYFRVQSGHRYMFSLNNAEFVVMSAWEYNGTSQSTVIGRVSPSGYTTSRFAFTARGKFARIAFAHADTSVAITDDDKAAILAALSLKETASDNLAPVDTPTATDTHAAGSLLTVSGQLYKATQAIAPGETITPGTNVASTTVAAQLAERDTAIAAVDHAVRYDTVQSITDAQQAQARVNAGVVNARGMVNYGYDTPGSGEAGSSDAVRVAYTRVGTRITLNGTTGSNIWRLRISGTTIRTSGTPATSTTAVHTVLDPTHDYRFVLRLISGTCTRDDDGLLLYLTPYRASTQTQLALRASWYNGRGDYWRDIPASTIPENGAVCLLLSSASGTTFTNAVFEAVLEDVTERTGETGDLYTALERSGQNIAPSDTATAASTHTAGSLLTVSGQLYKATQAIAPGGTINPGTNVEETTVAAQLTDVKTSIVNDTFVEPWQAMCKKYFITAGDGWLSVSGNRLVYKPTSSTGNASVKVIVGEYASRSSSVSGYTPLISELIPVSVFGDAIKMGFYSSSDTSGRYPRLCYKFCAVSGGTVTPVSGAYGLVPAEAANNTLAEEVVPVPEGATHVFIGVYFSGYYAGTYEMVYKVDKG